MSKFKTDNLLLRMPNDFIGYFACIIIILGLFFSRALMSIGMMILIGNSILHPKVLQNFKSFFSQTHLVLLSGYFLLMAGSYFYSDDVPYYLERMQIMLPFIILPFSFHSLHKFSTESMDRLFFLVLILLTGGISWSLVHYFQQKALFDVGYGYSKMIPTPFKNDHIRFSLAVVFGITLSIDLISRYSDKMIRWGLMLFIILATFYLHILSAKTGLMVFYLLALIFLFKLIFNKKYRLNGILSLMLLIGLPFLMYVFSASFRNRLAYISYTISQMKNNHKEPNISDEGRIISYQYALDCISKHPLWGVGVGDVYHEMRQYYQRDFPNNDVVVLLPHNQFLMCGVAIGVIGFLYLLILQLYLFRLSLKRDLLLFSFWFMMFFAMLVEPLYETQYGTCMFLFFLLLLLQRRTKTE